VCEEMAQKIAKKKKKHYTKQLWITRKNIFEASNKTIEDVDYMHLGICKTSCKTLQGRREDIPYNCKILHEERI